MNVCAYLNFPHQKLSEFNETTMYSVQFCIDHFYQFGIFYVKKRAYALLSQAYKYLLKYHPVLKKMRLGCGWLFQKITHYVSGKK